ncbi:site-specific integrase [Neorhizobium sp. P12A]|uniref:tyrosine-type recombinase/integrase n=1 Tax=Neorhizobium sp. P12A TaxID=2268027 RepID=UPI0011EF468A|nr:site-specific integrase [Neorhizobium sp. P12A]KAA0699974.1 site-specific integrase [Neorhizobium sp. P12A]
MAKAANKLTASQLGKCTDAYKRYSDGAGLYLRVAGDGKKRAWVFMYTDKATGKQTELGLGSFLPVDAEKGVKLDHVTLAQARAAAEKIRDQIKAGDNPKAARKPVAAKTFGTVADELIADYERTGKFKGGDKSKHLSQWKQTMGENGPARALRKIPVDKVTTDDVERVLKPIWNTTHETANRVRGRIETVLGYAKAKKLRTGENPAVWKDNLEHLLKSSKDAKAKNHHPRVKYSDCAAFIAELRTKRGDGSLALEFTILCASRVGEVIGAKWKEIDLAASIWTIPAGRMKANTEHVVPLSSGAIAILNKIATFRGTDPAAYVFQGCRRTGQPRGAAPPLTPSALLFIVHLIAGKGKATAHGFRSSFRDFAGDMTNHPREIAEAALAHTVGNAVERTYRQNTAIEKRRVLMQEWCDYLNAEENVVSLSEARAARNAG